MPTTISRAAYADMFGPTIGDRVRLADTDLIIEVEKDFTTYREEVKFGVSTPVVAGLVPATPFSLARACHNDRDGRDKPSHDDA